MSSNLFRVGLEHFLGLASVLWCCGFLLGCAGQPQKDMYFRMRPPTSEVPFFHKNNSIGFSTQTESRRFTIHPTNNLLTKFNFDNNEIYANEKGIPGFDLAFVYTKYLGQFPFELYVSTDFVKLKFQIFDARSEGSGLLLSGNLGQAKTAFFQSTSACGFLCFDNAASEKNRTIEDGIKVSGEGTERKIGMSLGYYFNEKWGSFISYNRFDAVIQMSAERLTGVPLNIDSLEHVGAVAHGGGVFFHPGKDVLLSLNVDNVTMKWRTVELSRVIFGFVFSWNFLGTDD
ncbi:MAG: hypothetical protein IPK04_15305 [Bdellovibrionales bacterium]|nr:hypothetical protein [Bdellovibrionales bacterium]